MNQPADLVRRPARYAVGLIVAMVIGFSPMVLLQPALASSAASYSIWNGSPYIANVANPDAGGVEVGVKFRTDLAGIVTGIRFYKGPGNLGTHVGDLWNATGTRLGTVTFTNETATGWQQASFASPVPISSGVTYIAAYYAPNGHYATTVGLTPGDFTTAVDYPPLHALQSGADGPNGVYAYGATSVFPNLAAPNAANYWVDVVFSTTVTTPPVAGQLSPANGMTGVAQNTMVTAQLTEAVQPSTIAFTLTDSTGTQVPARVTWELERADRTVTLDPVSDLAAGTTYTASLSGATDVAGNVMAPVSWSFTTATSAEGPQSLIGQWQPVQRWPLVAVHAAVLRTGKFIGWDPQSPSTTSRQYDPATGTFTSADMVLELFCAGHAEMADGRLMVVGGDHGDNATATSLYGVAINASFAYDPATGVWTRLPNMHLPRWYPAVVRLADGRILALSGEQQAGLWADTPEVYDPQSNTWTLLSKVNTSDVHEDLYPNAYLLPNGQVMVIANSTGHTWILDVNTQSWTQGPTAPLQNASSVMYRPGKILMSGGSSNGYGTATVAGAAVIDMTAAAPAWQVVPSMHFARGYHQLDNLPDGRVLAVSGSTIFTTSSQSGVLAAELWDPGSGVWSVLGSMQDPRMNHSTAVLMPDGTVLAAGGGHELQTGAADYFTAESYSPPYLFGGARPTITATPASAGYGAAITVQTPDASSIASVALIGLSAQTHHYDSGAVYVSLPFTAAAGQLTATMPLTTGAAAPGYYMLFLVNTAGVPSVASMVQLTGTDAAPPVAEDGTPVNGSTNIGIGTALSATFTKPVQGSSIQFNLRDSSGAAVATTMSVNAVTNRATFTPIAPLQFGMTYTATVTGASDLAGHAMASPYSWSFTAASSAPLWPSTIWSPSSTPGLAASSDSNAVELGLVFRPDISGFICGLRFYKGQGNGGTHVGNLWSTTGTNLATVTFSGESASGWQQAAFANPVAVTAGTTYVISYFAPKGHYAYDGGAFAGSGVDNPPLHALQSGVAGGNGAYTYSSGSVFPTSSANSANYWVDPVFELAPNARGPSITAQSPAPGAAGVAASIPVTATFDRAVQPGSISFTLTPSGGAVVVGTVSYSSLTRTVSFSPSAPLVAGTTYTEQVSGATDLAGRIMAVPVSWSFTVAALASCPCTIWSPSSTPGLAASSDSNAVELGLLFRPDTSGFITGLRFYKGPGNGGTHVGDLWSTTGTNLATVTFSGESASGWQQAAFANPVAVTAGTTYVISYFAPKGHYAYDGGAFAGSGVDNPPLHALQSGLAGGNGAYTYSSGSVFPTSSANSANYWVDPVFELAPNASAPAIAAQFPAPAATGVGVAVVVTATFDRAAQPGSISFTLTPSGGAAVVGTVSYSSLTRTVSFSPSAPLVAGTTYTEQVSGATDLAGHIMAVPVSWSFTVAALASCPCTIWSPSSTPGLAASSDSNAVELGLLFRPDTSGFITGLRFYKGAGNGGTHVGNLWGATGTNLARVSFSGESAAGWQQAAFANPVAVIAGTTYVISYFAPKGHYAYDGKYFTNAGVDNAPLHALQSGVAGGNGAYTYSSGSVFPTSSANSANYWVDPVFEPAPDAAGPTITAQTPAAGATAVSAGAVTTATFDRAVQPGTVTFTLTAAGGGAVAGTLSYNCLNRTMTFAPSTPLAAGATYTASVSGATDLAGHVMATPATWSFTTA